MSAEEIQKQMNDLYYWDARVLQFNCNCFADEIELLYQDEDFDVVYRFIGCYKFVFDHDKGYNKDFPVKEMSIPQIPYFLQSVEVGEATEEDTSFFTCKINMFPLDVEIWCKDIKIAKQPR